MFNDVGDISRMQFRQQFRQLVPELIADAVLNRVFDGAVHDFFPARILAASLAAAKQSSNVWKTRDHFFQGLETRAVNR
jgi:hypothetical protein